MKIAQQQLKIELPNKPDSKSLAEEFLLANAVAGGSGD
jgi:hypothetical protein